jgi:DNA polymerase
MIDHCYIDIETYSAKPIEHGTWAYAGDKSTEIMMIGLAINEGPVIQWVLSETDMPDEIREVIGRRGDPSLMLHAFNAQFERALFFHHFKDLDFSIDQWQCDQALALSLALPGHLGQVGAVIGLPEEDQKLKTGKALIRTFCMPRKPTKHKPWTRNTAETHPDEWEQFKEYHVGDIVSERAMHKRLRKWDLPEAEWEMWRLDQRINQTGLPIDTKLIEHAVPLTENYKAELLEEASLLTGLENANSPKQVGIWLRDRGIVVPNMQKATLEDLLLTDGLSEKARRVIDIRLQTGKTSTTKYTALKNGLCGDENLRGCFQFAGAGRTWRFAGRVFQPQNLPRPELNTSDLELATEMIRSGEGSALPMFLKKEPIKVLSSCIRSAVRAPEGYELVVADLASIENVVLGWVAECQGINEIHRRGEDPYKAFGVSYYDKYYEDITKDERNLCKPPVLGCGFGLGGGAEKLDKKTELMKKTGLWGYAHNMGVEMEKEFAHEAVAMWREKYWEVPDFWYEIDDAMRQIITNKKRGKVRPIDVGPVRFVYEKPFVRIELPSGHALSYLRAKLEYRIPPWEEEEEHPKPRLTVTYEGRADGGARGGWYRVSTHPGKICENIVQALARDVLCAGLKRASERGFTIVGHVHDEILALVKKGSNLGLDQLIECMVEPLDWASDMRLRADGYTSPFFRKG